jgi:ABC-2 type transport system permease protein
MADHVTSKRFIIILILVIAMTIASVYGAVTGIKSAIMNAAIDKNASFDASYMFLKLFTTGGSSIPSYMSLIALIGPFIGLILGFDSINAEKNNGTLNRLVSQPIYRDTIIIGKFLASSTLIVVMVLSTGIAVGCAGFLASGIRPSGEEAVRVLIYLLYTIVYICFWLAMALLFSVFTSHAATSALASIALWLFFAIFMSLLAGIMANAVYPVNTEYEQAVNALNNYNLKLNLNRISPYYLYSEASSVLMNPATRAINAVSYAQLVGALSSYLSLGQSLFLVWPHLVGLLALSFAAFTISYVGFMRQEIRGN